MLKVLEKTEKDLKDGKFYMLSEKDIENLEWAIKFLQTYERKHK